MYLFNSNQQLQVIPLRQMRIILTKMYKIVWFTQHRNLYPIFLQNAYKFQMRSKLH